jgi:hypothetical protein
VRDAGDFRERAVFYSEIIDKCLLHDTRFT